MNGDIMQMLQSLPEEERQAALQAISMNYGGQQGEIEKQQEQAQALRNTAMPEGRQAGQIYQAANPLEFLGAGMKQYQGMKQSQKAGDAMQASMGAQQDDDERLQKLLMGLRG